MIVSDYNETKDGKEQLAEVRSLQEKIDDILCDVRRKTDETSFGAFVDWDDSGFYEDGSI